MFIKHSMMVLLLIVMAPVFTICPSKMGITVYFICVATWLSMHNVQENYEPLNYFPWNEVNVVRKRKPVSTVIQCDVKHVMDVKPDYDYLTHYNVDGINQEDQ